MERGPYGESATPLHVLVVMVLHVAAIGGGCVGALLVHRWQTRSIYVSDEQAEYIVVILSVLSTLLSSSAG